jgi:hypothetical protein
MARLRPLTPSKRHRNRNKSLRDAVSSEEALKRGIDLSKNHSIGQRKAEQEKMFFGSHKRRTFQSWDLDSRLTGGA